MSSADFSAAFKFRPDLAGFVGIEVEGFLKDPSTGLIVPRAAEFLDGMRRTTWGEELSACQVEFRTRPLHSFDQIEAELADCFTEGDRRANSLSLAVDYAELGDAKMPLDIFPGNTRYREIASSLAPERLRAACRVAGVHIHYGVSGWDEALLVYNRVRSNLSCLATMGDNSGGERLRLYHLVAPRRDPPTVDSVGHYYMLALEHGFALNPRGCWWLVRISPYGTVEVRVFGSTRDIKKIVAWVRTIAEIARPSAQW